MHKKTTANLSTNSPQWKSELWIRKGGGLWLCKALIWFFLFLGWSRMANGWNAPPNEVALIEIGAGLISRECSTNATWSMFLGSYMLYLSISMGLVVTFFSLNFGENERLDFSGSFVVCHVATWMIKGPGQIHGIIAVRGHYVHFGSDHLSFMH